MPECGLRDAVLFPDNNNPRGQQMDHLLRILVLKTPIRRPNQRMMECAQKTLTGETLGTTEQDPRDDVRSCTIASRTPQLHHDHREAYVLHQPQIGKRVTACVR